MALDEILNGLNAEQLEAVKTLSSVVVSAGAGSGKTKVLASRFAYLVIEKGLKVDEILTLTFTNKATNEMYSRIYRLLSGQDGDAARAAIRDFHKARIQTLDSFCAEICTLASARYGVKSDFTTGADAVYDMASEAALSFVLDNRGSPGIKALITDNKIRDIAQGLFAGIVTEYGSLTNPLPFDRYIQKQRRELIEKWRLYSDSVDEMAAVIKRELPGVKNVTTATYKNFYALFNGELDLSRPEIEALFTGRSDSPDSSAQKNAVRESLYRFLAELAGINGLRKVGKTGGMETIGEVHGNFKDEVYPQIVKIAAMALNFDTVRDVFLLLDKFQTEFNKQKRLSGIMTFNDVAELALTILKNEADIRNIYTEKIKAVMIDEFQDNNELQRELLFLTGKGGIFFVGDQKQSIYRFRGADVSVFRKLGRDIEKNIRLKINYRSSVSLIQVFNEIFSRVFPEKNDDVPDFEAEYEPLAWPSSGTPEDGAPSAGGPEKVQVCLFDKNNLSRDAECGAEDVEAAFVAEKIRRMVDGAYQVRDRESGKNRACIYSDFAVLERSVSHQHNLEKQLRAFGVPYNSENCAGLFTDAPANDTYNFLRLLVYPNDKSAYAAVLRSPFARLSDLTLTVCMLKFSGLPFDPVVENDLPEAERAPYRRAGSMYYELLRGIRERNLGSAELVTSLWYDYGYRYDTLWSREAQVYNDIYDYLFELARINDANGKTLAAFVDYLDGLVRKKEKLSDFDLPLERREGVKIMTIHKSKGLEFPIVFIYGAGSHGQNVKNTGLAAYSSEWGVSLNLKAPENFPVADTGNYFFDMTRETEKQKEEAELRRLLYVAMTRAEDTLVISGVKNTKNTGVKSFLDLLGPVLSGGNAQLFSEEDIEARTRAEIREAALRSGSAGKKTTSMRKAADAAAEKYALAAETEKPEIFITRKPASRLSESAAAHLGEKPGYAEREASTFDGDDGFFEKLGLTPVEFGILVHSVIEERFSTGGAALERHLNSAAEKLANQYASAFFESDIGKKSLRSSFRKTEFSFMSLYREGGKKTYISGVMDLLFEFENEIYIVDYKTDRLIDPEKHRKQLAVYSRAAENLFTKKTRACLFYLREGRLFEF
ncbi:MAG: UvrD-helicase domain-containing protein [Spirochaetaceae bacterium]|jgi:ATP-dependent helicase/nuclease subunit A|nr:UvrD-helicase domain-containing protein [Spirochaetaceae bacterium]